MNKLTVFLLAILALSALLVSCVDTVSPPSTPPSVSADEAVFGVFCAYMAEDGRFSADGSAVLLAADEEGSLLVTALHVLYTERSDAVREGIYLHAPGREAEAGIPAVCVWEDPECDLALLRTATDLGTPPAICEDVPDAGATVFALGNGGGTGVRKKTGSILEGRTALSLPVDYRAEPLSLSLLSFTGELSSGDSGGGLFDAQGRLLGVINAMRSDGTAGYAIPAAHAAALLAGYRGQ